jgi:hypothetical protein
VRVRSSDIPNRHIRSSLPAVHCQVSNEAIPFKDIAHLKMEFDVALQQVAALCANPAHDAVLREDNCVSPASLPRFRRAHTRLHQSRAQIVKQFRIDFVVVFRWNRVESGRSLTESRREGRYPRGGRSSDGAESGTLSVPANRSIACRTAPARRIDSLHCRCLTSNSFASGGGAVAFIANSATNSSRVISDRGMVLPFRTDGFREGVTQASSRVLRPGQRRSRNFGVRRRKQVANLVDAHVGIWLRNT